MFLFFGSYGRFLGSIPGVSWLSGAIYLRSGVGAVLFVMVGSVDLVAVSLRR